MEYENLLWENRGNYALLSLSRPQKLNALNSGLLSELSDALNHFHDAGSIEGLIITGSGEKAFAAGADIEELRAAAESGEEFSRFGSSIFSKIENSSKPIIAAINGYALGGGFELALACHIRYASENARMGLPELSLGVIPGYGGTQRLTKLIGKSNALEAILSGRQFTPERALALGIVSEVFKRDELIVKAEEKLQIILSKSPIARAAAIRCVRLAESADIRDGLTHESREFGAACASEDFLEGTSAFLEKRSPNFKGK
ncbi:MAG: enoyl-CoA hydratase/isomerase family protein [Chloroflexota bacterium]